MLLRGWGSFEVVAVTIVLASLDQGGAQRSALVLSRDLIKCGFEVDLLVFDRFNYSFFDIGEGVRVTYLRGLAFQQLSTRGDPWFWFLLPILRRAARVLWLFSLRKTLVKALEPDVVVCFEKSVAERVQLALIGSHHPIISSFRVFPFRQRDNGSMWERLVRFGSSLRGNVHYTAQSESIATELELIWGKSATVIPNAVVPAADIIPGVADRKKVVLCMSRYVPQKGIDVLLRAWAKTSIRAEWRLEVYGDGVRDPYLALADDLGVADSVTLFGATKRPNDLYVRAGVFVLPSRFEGFPNSLAEAMAHGLPSIAADCPGAVRSLTGLDGNRAILVPPEDPRALALALDEVASNFSLRSSLSHNAQQVAQIFDSERITKQWVSLIRDVVGSRASRQLGVRGVRGG